MLPVSRPAPRLVLLIVPLLLALFFARWVPRQSLSVVQGDSSMFLYVGQQINNGLTPYADVWDHKPPLIFYLNALALRIADGSPRGILILAYLFLLVFVAATWAVLRPGSGDYPAILAALLTINLFPDLVLIPNFTEVFSLPFQALSFFLLAEELDGAGQSWHPMLQGMIAAALFQLRPNNAAVIVVYLGAITFHALRTRQLRRLLRQLGLFTAFFVIGNLVILWPLISRGYLRHYLDAAFRFNLRYSAQRSLSMHFYAIGVGIVKTSRFAGSCIAAAMAFVVIRTRPSWADRQDRLAILALILLLLEVACSAVSGMPFEHYFLMWLLPVAVLCGLFVRQCELYIPDRRKFAVPAFCGVCVFLLIASAFDSLRQAHLASVTFSDNRAGIVSYVREHAAADDRLFVWGGFGDLAFRTALRPASRYFSTVPMGHEAGAYRALGTEALRDVERSKPRFILEIPGEVPSIFRPDLAAADSIHPGWDSAELAAIKTELQAMYSLTYSDQSGIAVYEFKWPRVNSKAP